MKVIKKGTPHRGWSKKRTFSGMSNGLNGCQAELLVEQRDLYVTLFTRRDETDLYTTFTCPECGANPRDFDIPESLQETWRAIVSKIQDAIETQHRNTCTGRPLETL